MHNQAVSNADRPSPVVLEQHFNLAADSGERTSNASTTFSIAEVESSSGSGSLGGGKGGLPAKAKAKGQTSIFRKLSNKVNKAVQSIKKKVSVGQGDGRLDSQVGF